MSAHFLNSVIDLRAGIQFLNTMDLPSLRFTTSKRLCMKIWIVEVGEPLPLEHCHNRPYRYSQLFDKLSSRGHDVIWWASNFSHQHKEKIITDSDKITIGANKSIRLINMPAYKSNLSVMRVVSQAITGVRFYRAISKENPPDLIVSAYPVIEMAFFSVFFSYKKRIPVIVDVQDLWPDIFVGIKSFLKKMQYDLKTE